MTQAVEKNESLSKTAADLGTRPPPHSLEAEQALLGSLLHNNLAHEKVSEFLQPEHFADEAHGRIYDAITRLINRGHVADPITLKDYFENDDSLQDVGGSQYLAELAASTVTVINVAHYGKQIFDLSLRRQLIDVGEDIVNEAHVYDLDVSATDQLELAEKKLFDLATTGQTDKGFTSIDSALVEAIQTAEVAYKSDSKIVGISTGFTDLDQKLGGLHPSDLIIVAARPSMGKTAFVTNIAYSAALSGMNTDKDSTVAFFSLEMSAEQLACRLLGQESGISSDKIRRGEIGKDSFGTFDQVSRRLTKLPLYIDDTPALSVSALRTRCRRLKRQQGLGLIIIDYLQLLGPAGGSRGAENRVQELSEITRTLKAIAKELNVPVIACSQLSRAVEQREDKRPQLSDLRESGSIEQDADVVMFLFREEYYEGRLQPAQSDTEKYLKWQAKMAEIHNLAEVILGKQRHGPIGTVKLHFKGELTKFSDYIEPSQVPANYA